MFNRENKLHVLIGPEGGGKSMVGKRVASLQNLTYVSTGDILRNYRDNDKTVGGMGDICREMFAKGDYLKPQMILDVLEKWFKENKINKNGMILDGGLRTLEETEGFQGMLDKTGKRFFVDVICIRVPGWKAYERSYDRQRFNDTPKEILRRLGSYYDNLGLRMVTIRNNNWPVHIIDANETKDEVFQNVLGVVGTKNKLSCGLFSYLRSFR